MPWRQYVYLATQMTKGMVKITKILLQCGSECPEFCPIRLVEIILAWVATIAGTFTLLGSVCNLIVAEKARSITNYRLTFLRYLKFVLVSATVMALQGFPLHIFWRQ